MLSINTFCIKTFGCQMNKNDSERMVCLLEDAGYRQLETWQQSELVILNSCSIRDKAERRVIGHIHEIDHFRKNNNGKPYIALTGCMPQYAAAKIASTYPAIDFIVGANNFEMLPELLKEHRSSSIQATYIRKSRREEDVEVFEDTLAGTTRKEKERAWLTIMFGCDNFCSYCIVPSTRGRERSRLRGNIFNEIENLISDGVNDITLLGQNVNSYGKNIYKGSYRFPDLLSDIAIRFPTLKKLSFLTSHPKDIDEKLFEIIASHKVISKDVHFPLQHGSDSILASMNRGYTVEDYENLVYKARKIITGVRIGTDLIVGYPGEGEHEFQTMLDTCRRIRFDFFNTAMYSKREGTVAANLKNQVPDEIKLQRLHRLNDLLTSIAS
jgi:tRNA-2-methylthio-N6-dimethylallyladenosine synthase